MLKDESETEISNYFRSNLLSVRKAIQQQDFKRFTSLNSNSERVDFIMRYPEAHCLPLEVENPEMKNNEKAQRLKDVGNKFYGRGEFRKALETYSNAVLLAPQQDLAIILANRSATLYNLERYDYALEDTKEAINAGYPEELMYKLEERRAKCFLGLKRHGEALESFKKALKALDKAKLTMEKSQKLEADIRIMLAVMEKGNQLSQGAKKIPQKKIHSVNQDDKPILPKMTECNPLYPACSKAVKIKDDSDDRGRYAVASRDIEPGEILAIEKPHCAFLLAEYRLTNCHRCFTKIFVPTPAACKTCSSVAYCSIRCRNADAEIHKRECKLLPALWASKASISCFLALRAIIQRPYEEIIKMKDRLKPLNISEITADRPYLGKNYETFYSLVTHENERSAEDLYHRAYIASWLLRLLKVSNYFPEGVKTPDSADAKLSDGEFFVAGLLLHNLMLQQFNSHEVSELTVPRDNKTLSKAKNTFIGGGIYPTVALFNHSCNPGIVRYFVGTTMVARAIRSIPAGEEISENYGPIFTTTVEAERKRRLRVQYWFECNCEACTAHWPLLENIDPTILRFKCETGPKCGNILPVRMDTEEFMIKCPKCGNNANILKGLKALQDTDALLRTATRNLEEGQHLHALDAFLKILKILDETLALPIRDYHLCQQTVRVCMLKLGNNTFV